MKKQEDPSKVDPAALLQTFLQKNGLAISAVPQFIARDDGTFSTVVRVSVSYKQ